MVKASVMSLLAHYETWVRANGHAVTAVDGALSSLTWLLPDRFSSSELNLEAFNALLGLLNLYHESILMTPPVGRHKAASVPLWLGALQQVEVLVEMGSNLLEQRGLMNKYSVLAALEILKGALRLVTWRQVGGRISIAGEEATKQAEALTPEVRLRAVVVALARFHRYHTSQPCQNEASGATATDSSTCSVMPACPQVAIDDRPRATQVRGCGTALASETGAHGMHATGIRVSGASAAACSNSEPDDYWWEWPRQCSTSVAAEERDSQQQLLDQQAEHRWCGGMLMVASGELLHLSRPILYTLALRRWGRQNWKPWILSLALDLLSQSTVIAASYSSAQSMAHPEAHAKTQRVLPKSKWALQQVHRPLRWGDAERQELAQRRVALLFYLLRSPFFDRWTKGSLDVATDLLLPVPVLGMLARRAEEIICGTQKYYTYTSAS